MHHNRIAHRYDLRHSMGNDISLTLFTQLHSCINAGGVAIERQCQEESLLDHIAAPPTVKYWYINLEHSMRFTDDPLPRAPIHKDMIREVKAPEIKSGEDGQYDPFALDVFYLGYLISQHIIHVSFTLSACMSPLTTD